MDYILDADDTENDVLKLSVDDWCNLLKNQKIFNDKIMEIITYIYGQRGHESTATEIALNYNLIHDCDVTHKEVAGWYVDAARKIYDICGKAPKIGSNRQRRFWNTFFIMTKDPKCQKVKKFGKSLYRLILRPELATALERMQLVHT